MAARFRGYLPVVLDVETGGFNARTDALLEVAATPLEMSESGDLVCGPTFSHAVLPFADANIEQASLDFTGIDPYDTERGAIDEGEALRSLFSDIRHAVRAAGCKRAILVGHNAFFDHGFLFAAAERQQIKRNPFHPFSTFDTVTLAGMAFGQTVLAKACAMAGIEFSARKAHRASYDCEKTAELFCVIVNRWQQALGWPPADPSG
ncbi:MAG: ribonuclease T [Gammaproteobacteria bacterium]|nr:ribonuclease T [Gammaproteobacteria bacterium]